MSIGVVVDVEGEAGANAIVLSLNKLLLGCKCVCWFILVRNNWRELSLHL